MGGLIAKKQHLPNFRWRNLFEPLWNLIKSLVAISTVTTIIICDIRYQLHTWLQSHTFRLSCWLTSICRVSSNCSRTAACCSMGSFGKNSKNSALSSRRSSTAAVCRPSSPSSTFWRAPIRWITFVSVGMLLYNSC